MKYSRAKSNLHARVAKYFMSIQHTPLKPGGCYIQHHSVNPMGDHVMFEAFSRVVCNTNSYVLNQLVNSFIHSSYSQSTQEFLPSHCVN